MENFNKNIDRLFSDESKKAEENATFPSFEKVWEKIENRLDETKTEKRVISIWLPYSVAASLVFIFGIMYFLDDKNVNSTSASVASSNGVKYIDNKKVISYINHVKVAKIDRTIKQNIKKNSLEKVSRGNNPVEVKLGLSQILASNPVAKTETESPPEVISELSKLSETKDRVVTLSELEPSSVISEKKALDSEIIIKTKKSESSETVRMALSNQKKSEQLTAIAKQSVLADNAELENVNDFKISNQHDSEPLYIVDGYVADAKFLKKYNKKKITSLNIIEGNSAKKLYGNLAKKGVVVITTKGLNPQEVDYLKKNSKDYNFSEVAN